jgi:hypothetical protein
MSPVKTHRSGRSVFRRNCRKNKEFFVEYEFVNTVQYHDFDPDSGLNEAIRQAAAQEILTPDNIGPGRKYAEVLPEDLAEQLPHIRFYTVYAVPCGKADGRAR